MADEGNVEQEFLTLLRRLAGNNANANPNPNPAPRAMPFPGERGAPKFDGEAYLFDTFVQSFRHKAAEAQLDPGDMKKTIVTYLSQSERELWMVQDSFSNANSNFDAFITEIRTLYADEIGTVKKSTLEDLNKVIATHSAEGFTNQNDVSRYSREFNRHSKSLRDQQLVFNTTELFISAFKEEDRTAIKQRLQIKHPDTPFWQNSSEHLVEAAKFIIQNNAPAKEQRAVFERGASAVRRVKQESTSEDRMLAMVSQLFDEKIAKYANLNTAPSQSNVARYQTANSYGNGTPASTASTIPRDQCLFCYGVGHNMRSCPERQKYMTEGKIQVDVNGRTVLPGGQNLPVGRDISMKQKIDDFWKAQNIQSESHFYEHEAFMIEAMEDEDESTIEPTPEEIDHTTYMQALQLVQNYEATGRPGAKRFDGIELPRRAGPIPRRPSTPFRNDNNQSNRGGVIPITGTERANGGKEMPTKEKTVPASPREAERRHKEQTKEAHEKLGDVAPVTTRNKAPATDDDAANRIFQMCLGNQVTVSVKDLLGASPDIRRLVQKFTTNRRSPEAVNMIDTSQEDEEDDDDRHLAQVFQIAAYDHLILRTETGEYAAHETVPLLCIRMTIEDVNIDTIIDTGATICCISDRVWRRIGSGALMSRSIPMRDANGN
ncbi:hypothetical protein EXIGLDRAFT_782896, partial [Exidia glandulosa HHB12029]